MQKKMMTKGPIDKLIATIIGIPIDRLIATIIGTPCWGVEEGAREASGGQVASCIAVDCLML